MCQESTLKLLQSEPGRKWRVGEVAEQQGTIFQTASRDLIKLHKYKLIKKELFVPGKTGKAVRYWWDG